VPLKKAKLSQLGHFNIRVPKSYFPESNAGSTAIVIICRACRTNIWYGTGHRIGFRVRLTGCGEISHCFLVKNKLATFIFHLYSLLAI
jgi:hypothetical protein